MSDYSSTTFGLENFDLKGRLIKTPLVSNNLLLAMSNNNSLLIKVNIGANNKENATKYFFEAIPYFSLSDEDRKKYCLDWDREISHNSLMKTILNTEKLNISTLKSKIGEEMDKYKSPIFVSSLMKDHEEIVDKRIDNTAKYFLQPINHINTNIRLFFYVEPGLSSLLKDSYPMSIMANYFSGNFIFLNENFLNGKIDKKIISLAIKYDLGSFIELYKNFYTLITSDYTKDIIESLFFNNGKQNYIDDNLFIMGGCGKDFSKTDYKKYICRAFEQDNKKVVTYLATLVNSIYSYLTLKSSEKKVSQNVIGIINEIFNDMLHPNLVENDVYYYKELPAMDKKYRENFKKFLFKCVVSIVQNKFIPPNNSAYKSLAKLKEHFIIDLQNPEDSQYIEIFRQGILLKARYFYGYKNDIYFYETSNKNIQGKLVVMPEKDFIKENKIFPSHSTFYLIYNQEGKIIQERKNFSTKDEDETIDIDFFDQTFEEMEKEGGGLYEIFRPIIHSSEKMFQSLDCFIPDRKVITEFENQNDAKNGSNKELPKALLEVMRFHNSPAKEGDDSLKYKETVENPKDPKKTFMHVVPQNFLKSIWKFGNNYKIFLSFLQKINKYSLIEKKFMDYFTISNNIFNAYEKDKLLESIMLYIEKENMSSEKIMRMNIAFTKILENRLPSKYSNFASTEINMKEIINEIIIKNFTDTIFIFSDMTPLYQDLEKEFNILISEEKEIAEKFKRLLPTSKFIFEFLSNLENFLSTYYRNGEYYRHEFALCTVFKLYCSYMDGSKNISSIEKAIKNTRPASNKDLFFLQAEHILNSLLQGNLNFPAYVNTATPANITKDRVLKFHTDLFSRETIYKLLYKTIIDNKRKIMELEHYKSKTLEIVHDCLNPFNMIAHDDIFRILDIHEKLSKNKNPTTINFFNFVSSIKTNKTVIFDFIEKINSKHNPSIKTFVVFNNKNENTDYDLFLQLIDLFPYQRIFDNILDFAENKDLLSYDFNIHRSLLSTFKKNDNPSIFFTAYKKANFKYLENLVDEELENYEEMVTKQSSDRSIIGKLATIGSLLAKEKESIIENTKLAKVFTDPGDFILRNVGEVRTVINEFLNILEKFFNKYMKDFESKLFAKISSSISDIYKNLRVSNIDYNLNAFLDLFSTENQKSDINFYISSPLSLEMLDNLVKTDKKQEEKFTNYLYETITTNFSNIFKELFSIKNKQPSTKNDFYPNSLNSFIKESEMFTAQEKILMLATLKDASKKSQPMDMPPKDTKYVFELLNRDTHINTSNMHKRKFNIGKKTLDLLYYRDKKVNLIKIYILVNVYGKNYYTDILGLIPPHDTKKEQDSSSSDDESEIFFSEEHLDALSEKNKDYLLNIISSKYKLGSLSKDFIYRDGQNITKTTNTLPPLSSIPETFFSNTTYIPKSLILSTPGNEEYLLYSISILEDKARIQILLYLYKEAPTDEELKTPFYQLNSIFNRIRYYKSCLGKIDINTGFPKNDVSKGEDNDSLTKTSRVKSDIYESSRTKEINDKIEMCFALFDNIVLSSNVMRKKLSL